MPGKWKVRKSVNLYSESVESVFNPSRGILMRREGLLGFQKPGWQAIFWGFNA
jgi:hypothetical protein